MKKALITGISGQDGSYLSELLLEKGYEVHGIILRSELEEPGRSLWRLSSIIDQVNLHPASIEAYPSLFKVVEKVRPDECYHLAAQSFVSYSLDDEFSIFNTNVTGTHYILSVLKEIAPQCRFYFAASSELFGNAEYFPQNEFTPFHPRSAYGITKATGFYLTTNYREKHNLFACNGILYNHESPRRGYEYVTRKITNGAVKIKLGLQNEVRLGNLDAIRDWGYAKDYVYAMWLMLQEVKPDDYVIASGEPHTVREICEIAFSVLELNYKKYVVTDDKYFRPSENIPLIGDSSKARQNLGWEPTLSLRELITLMINEDYRLLLGKFYEK